MKTPWINRLCACGRRNEDHTDDSYDEHGTCLAVAELPSRDAYDVKTDASEPVRLALAVMRAAENEDGADE